MWAAMLGATVAMAAVSCAEATSGTSSTGPGGGGSGSTSAGTTSPASTGSGTTSATSGATTSASTGTSMGGGTVVINEISAKGEDWVELVNLSISPADISGYGLCDDVTAPTSMCDVDTIVRFPPGTVVPPGGYVLVIGNQDADAGAGPHSMCLTSGGPATCFYASWKVSASNGENVHFVDPSNQPVNEVLYPANAVPSGQTWGRLPDKTGSFAANKPTPGAANEAP
jgi:hypothetical protein